MTLEYSKYQKDIFHHVEKENCNILVNAVAGSGKTTTLIKCFDYTNPKYKILCLAYNKHIADELKTKVPDNVKVSTIYAVGLSALIRYYKIDNINKAIDPYKINKIINKYSKSWTEFKTNGEKLEYIKNLTSIINLCRLNLKLKPEQITGLCSYYGYNNIINKDVNRIIKIIEDDIKDTSTFDYTDMIFFPTINQKIFLTKYKYVFIDEVQDTNVCQQIIFKRCVHDKGGRFFAFGDPKQCIYTFMGANNNTFDKIKEIPNTKVLPLSISYRCGKEIINYAKRIVPYIEYNPDNVDGLVNKYGSAMEDAKEGDFVLCRDNGPLIKLFFYYIRNNIKCNFNGKEFSDSLKSLIKPYKDQRKTLAMCVTGLVKDLGDVRSQLVKLGVPNPEDHDSYCSLRDKIDVIKAFTDLGSITLSDIEDNINHYFESNNSGVILSTVHKAKGLEADRVFIIRPDILPNRKSPHAWEIESETNLFYVAITRAKKELIFDFEFDMGMKNEKEIKKLRDQK